MNDNLGKKAEDKIKEWLDRPEDGYCFDRLPDQMSGKYGSTNICDFILYKHPIMYYLESKATYEDRFDWSRILPHQKREMLQKNQIEGVEAYVIVLFASFRRAFMFNIQDIEDQLLQGKKSVNVTKISKWTIPYKEIKTIPSNRKALLDYAWEGNVL